MEFSTTRWSIVAASNDSDLQISQKALEELSQLYWFPLYSYVRSKGYQREEAEDLTQSFFLRFLDSKGFSKARPKRGNFRTFLLGCLKNFLIDEWKKGRAQKRGNGQAPLSLDFDRAERLVITAVDQTRSPEETYDYHWGKTIMARALNRVRGLYVANGKEKVFDALEEYLKSSEPSRPYAETAMLLNMKENAVKVAVHRLRARYKSALELEISDTLVVDDDVETEVEHLISIVSS